jgi:sortase A
MTTGTTASEEPASSETESGEAASTETASNGAQSPREATVTETKPEIVPPESAPEERTEPASDEPESGETKDEPGSNGARPAETKPEIVPPESAPEEQEEPASEESPAGASVMPWTRRRVAVAGVAWALITLVCAALVCYGLGPLSESRHQRSLLGDMRGRIARAVGAQESLFGGGKQTPRAPELGDPVAILQVPRLRLQQVIIEGADPARTQAGPGHVPGTAGPGQPGNAAVAARRFGFGAPFRRLDSLRAGDSIIISTTQGQSVYSVFSVTRHQNLARADPYTSSTDDRLTLVSSASSVPWEGSQGIVVVARMSGLPYPATPQGGRSHLQDGRHGDPTALALVILYAALFAGTAISAVLLYRRWLSLSTYLITAPILIALIVLAAEAAIRLLPAWT